MEKAGRGFPKADIFDFKLQNTVDEKILLKKFEKALKTGEKAETDLTVTSTDRAVGTILGSEITKNFKNTLSDDTFCVSCTGGGGQSFGAFIPKGLTIKLCGDANDYFGKGLSGGKLIVYPPKESTFKADETIIIGNVALYGATSGKAFINGACGERFCVRNSGAVAVCEGVGDHGLEYMTGGKALILGKTGKNFAAGMSGGIAYVYDPKHNLYKNINKALVAVDEVVEDSDKEQIKALLSEHYEATQSKKAKEILDNFEKESGSFKVVVPYDYKKILTEISKNKAKGMADEDAEIESFYAVTKG
ncbi:MAG: hypothetical protein IK072_00910 [Clostridia bacterium]|nr:hypothetical protein [Clostridia bacterium]